MEENYFSFLKDEKYNLIASQARFSVEPLFTKLFTKRSTSVSHLFQLLLFFMEFSGSSLKLL
jgi:hypothetical protein